MSERDDRPMPRWLVPPRAAWTLFVFAFVTRLLFVTLVHPPGEFLDSDMGVYDMRANHLLSGELGPWDSFTAAGYPAFLALNYALFGPAFTWVGVLQALLSALTVVMTYRLATLLIGDSTWAVVAGLIIALHLPTFLYAGLLLSETLFSFLVVFATLLLIHATRRRSVGLACIGALLLGLGCVVRPNLLIALPALPVFFFVALRGSPVRATVFSVLAFVVILGPLAAHSWHNSRLVDRFVPTSTNGGLNFYLNVAEVSAINFEEGSFTHYIRPVPNLLRYDDEEYTERPFYDDRHFYSRALDLLRDEPTRVLKFVWSLKEGLGLGWQEYWPSWRPWRILLGVESRIFTYAVVIPGLIGLFLVSRRWFGGQPSDPGWLFVGALVLANMLAMSAYLGDPRVRVPFDPFYAVAALLSYRSFAEWRRNRRPREALDPA